ncbi:MAG: hypothetical protein HOP10_02855 [Chitinophagaceae bacterium]|nr:hypothetical protein [Chitinophagaceae bacterium]
MKGLENPTNLILYIISNSLALLILFATWKNIRLGRLLFFMLFAWAGWTNWTTALNNPSAYLGEAELTFFNFYREFILGWFSSNIVLAVGFIASCQALIAVAMLGKTPLVKLGAIGGILFLVAIAPFGVGSAFPCTLVLAVAMGVILAKKEHSYLWMKQIQGKISKNAI